MSNDPIDMDRDPGENSRERELSLVDKTRNFILSVGKWKGVLGLALVLLALLGLAWGMDWLGPPKTADAGEVTITALLQDNTGIDPGSAFLLSTEQPINTKTVKENLKVSPAFTYDLEKRAGGKEFKIVPEEKLATNTVYRLAFDPTGNNREDLSWAFQTRGRFRVVGQLPQDETTGVPVDTGIEFTLTHEEYDLDTAQKYFSISPRVEGKLEKHKKTLVFVPQGLKPETLYTVTLKKGLPLLNGKEALTEDSVIRFETAGAQNQSNEAFSFDMDQRLNEFSTTEAPFFPVYFNARKNPPAVHIDLYRYLDHNGFAASLTKVDQIPRWSYWARSLYREDVKGLDKVAGYDTQFIKADQFSHYLSLPEALPTGYYLAEIKAGEGVCQAWFQVSDLAVYRAKNEKGTLFWANDLQSNSPARNIKVLVDNRQLAASKDDTGVVLTKENLFQAQSGYALLTSADKEILVPLALNRDSRAEERLAVQDYWKYLYLDRELYLPGDTVNFWGVLASRKGSPTELKEITVELRGYNGYYYGARTETPLKSQKVAIKGKTFEGKCELPVLKPGYYFLQIKSGDIVVLSRAFSVETYQKPAYQLTVEPEKKAILVGEKNVLQVKTAFFEGTPVPGIQLNHFVDGKTGKITTDDKGEARIPLVGNVPQDTYGLYYYQYLSVNANLPEIGAINASSGILVFFSRVYLTGEAKQERNSFTLKARLRNVDLTKANQEFRYSEDEFVTGPVANGQIKGRLYEEIWNKIERGERYDFINKKVEKIYDYQRSQQEIGEFVLTTGEDGFAAYKGEIDPEKIYFVELLSADQEGRTARTRIYINSFDDSRFKYYYLKDSNSHQGYEPGEEVSLALMENSKEVKVGRGRILFLRGQNQIDSYLVATSPRYEFKFTDEDIPNVNVQGVYFDGQNYQIADPYIVPFASQSRALKVKVKSNQVEYRPGNKVKLTIEVTDQKERPVKNVRVNLNLVDEALYAMGDQWVDLLRSIYQDYYYLGLEGWRSHYHPGLNGGAEKGGEGGAERKDFRDTVLFTTLETGNDGRASVEFKLPDNLTSWRVTYHALSPDLKAASGTQKIPVRLPFFVEMSVNDTYLVGDSPVVILRGYGSKLGLNQSVAYQMTLVNPKGHKTVQTGKGKSFTAFDWTLPQLEAGTYSLTVSATSGKYRDTLTRKFTVANALQERNVSQHEILKNGMVLQGGSVEPTDLIFCDYEKSQYLEGLYRLSWLGGGRLELKLARQEAKKLIKEYFPQEKADLTPEDDESMVEYQRPDGGIGILPYASSDLALSALVACDFSDKFDQEALIGYFYKTLENDGQDPSLALLGLAALDEPVLLKIKQTLKDSKLAPSARINLATALLQIGDGSEANQVYRELLNNNSQDLGNTMRIKVGRDQDEIVAATTQMAVLAARLNQPEKNKLYQYIIDNPGEEMINLLEQVQILKHNLRQMNPQSVSFSYSLDGKSQRVSLKNGETYKITVLPQDLKRIKFSQVQGQVGLMAQYTKPYTANEAILGQELSVSRQYQVKGTKSNSLARSDLVKVVINFKVGNKAPGGGWEIVDILPVGLVYVPRPYDYGVQYDRLNWWSYPSEVKGQKLTFSVGKGSGKGAGEITYYARVVSPGEFRAESPILSHVTSKGVFTQGTEERIKIK